MAVAAESFSIREYAERMRRVDLRRSCPFGVGREDVISLPSMLVRRFKWWTDELEAGRSEAGRSEAGVEDEHKLAKQAAGFEISDGEDIPSPVRKELEASASPSAEVDARRFVKGKQKTPKKRSIVELFAAAPLIAVAVDDIEEDSGDGDSRAEERDGGGTCVDQVAREMSVVIWKKKGIKQTNLKNKKGKKRKKKKGITKGLKLEIRALEKKKAKRGKSAKKHKVLRTLKPSPMKKDVAKKLPVRSILKKQKKSTKTVSAKAANLIKLYCQSNKHVTFSVKDDILGSARACKTMDFPQMQNLCKIFSDVLHGSTLNQTSKVYDSIDANDKPHDVNSCEIGTQKTEVSSTDCKNQSTVVNSSNSSCSGTEKASFAVMVDLNCAIEANDFDSFIPATSTLSSSCTCTGDPTSRATPNQNSTPEILFKAALPSSPEPSLVPAQHDNFIASSSAVNSLTLKENERQCQPHVDVGINFYSQFEDHQSTKGPLTGLCYSMGSKKFGESLFVPHSVSTCKSKCPDEDFIGLPLNSQGELIQFHSGARFNEAYKKQNVNLGSNSRKNHSELTKKKVFGSASCQKNYYSTKERVRHWLNFAELDGSKRPGIQRNEPDRFLHCNSNKKIHEYRNESDAQPKCSFDYHPQPVQPTMRLMGKNVVVGSISNDCHTFNDRRTSKNTENFVGQTRFSMFPDNLPPQQWMQRESAAYSTIGRSIGNPFHVADSTPNFYNAKSFQPPLDYMHAHQPQWPSRSGDSHMFKGDMENHLLPSQAFLNNPSQFLGNYISGQGSIGAELHYTAVGPSHPQNVHQNILMSSSHCENDRRFFHGGAKPQFKYPDFEKFSEPSQVQPSEALPHWLLNAKEQNSHYPHLVANNTNMKKKDMNATYSNFTCFKAPVDARKRPADFNDGNTNPAKRPSKGKEVSMNFPQTANGNGAYGSTAGPSSSRFDKELRSGPIKLIGGAKHILKPCQMIDSENCRPIHSTIIFPSNAASFGAEKKFANIYKF